MQHADLGGHQDLAGGLAVLAADALALRGVEHLAGGQQVHALRLDGALAGHVDGRVRAAALRVDVQVGVRVGGGAARQLLTVDVGVHVALARPDEDVVAAGLALDVGAEELIRVEQDGLVGGQRVHHVDGVGGGAADVGLRLHVGGGVDVADHQRARVLGLPLAQLLGGDGVRQGAAGPLVGDDDRLVRAEDLRSLRHEVDAAEDDDVRVGLGGDARQAEGVAHVIGDVLDFRQLVVVRQDDGVALLGQAAHFVGPFRRGLDAFVSGGRVDHRRGQIRVDGLKRRGGLGGHGCGHFDSLIVRRPMLRGCRSRCPTILVPV